MGASWDKPCATRAQPVRLETQRPRPELHSSRAAMGRDSQEAAFEWEQLALEPGELPSGGRILTWGWASARGWPVTVLMLTEHSSN